MKYKNWQRYTLQWGVLGVLVLFLTGILGTGSRTNPEAYCPFGGIQAFARYVSLGSLPCDMSSAQIILGIALVVAVVLFSKLFCAYLCPLGTTGDLLMKLRSRLKIRPITVPSKGILDKVLRIVKYFLLFWILYNTLATGELFCKKIDPYYAVATGFKGEITLWISIAMIILLLFSSFFIDNFWCRYICPLGALSNTLKYWLWLITLLGIVALVSFTAKQFPVWCIIALFCTAGYLFEILHPRTNLQAIYVQRKNSCCNNCSLCEKRCPYHIHIKSFNGGVEDVDCMLCGECVANCPSSALHIGFTKKGRPNAWNRSLPALLTVILTLSAFFVARQYEFPTINECWEQNDSDTTFTLEGLTQVRCYASSRSFMKKLQSIEGVHGVKTFVKQHRATILYNPTITDPEKIQKDLFTSARFQVSAPDYHTIPELRIITLRIDKMTRPNDVNLLGLQFKQLDSLVYGLETEWDVPLIVKMYVHPEFDKDEEWIKNVANTPVLELKNAHTGKVTQMQLGFEYIRMEKPDSTIRTVDFLHHMFKPYVAEITPVSEVAPFIDQYLYIIPEKNVSKPMYQRNLPLLVSYLRGHEGIGSVYTSLDENCDPILIIRHFHPMTGDKLHNLLSASEWTIAKKDGLHKVQAPITYSEKGIIQKL